MAKRESAEVKILRLFDSLSTEGKRIVFELIRSARVVPKSPAPSVARKSSTKSGAKSTTANGKIEKGAAGNAATSPAQELAIVTGRSVEDCTAALGANGGDKKLAMLALTSDAGQVRGE